MFHGDKVQKPVEPLLILLEVWGAFISFKQLIIQWLTNIFLGKYRMLWKQYETLFHLSCFLLLHVNDLENTHFTNRMSNVRLFNAKRCKMRFEMIFLRALCCTICRSVEAPLVESWMKNHVSEVEWWQLFIVKSCGVFSTVYVVLVLHFSRLKFSHLKNRKWLLVVLFSTCLSELMAKIRSCIWFQHRCQTWSVEMIS